MLGTVDSLVAVATGIEALPAADALACAEDEWVRLWVCVMFVDALRDVIGAVLRSIGNAPKLSPALLRNDYAAPEEIHNPQSRPALDGENVDGHKAKEENEKNGCLDDSIVVAGFTKCYWPEVGTEREIHERFDRPKFGGVILRAE